ncbi:MAG: ABC transporter permease subunit [Phycisphaerae bacterium]
MSEQTKGETSLVSAEKQHSLLFSGEAMVWLMGGGAALAVCMIVALLATIIYFGTTTFWPLPLEQMTVQKWEKNAQTGALERSPTVETWLGEPVDASEFVPAGETATQRRVLYRTGNFDVSGTDFTWVTDRDVVTRTAPAWALVLERQEWGNAYGTIEKVIVDGVVTEGGAAAWAKLQEVHGPMRALFDQIYHINKYELGDLSAQLKHLEQERTRAKNRHGAKSAEFRAVEADIAQRSVPIQAEIDRYKVQVDELRRKMAVAQVVIRTADNQVIPADRGHLENPMYVWQIVRVYPANQLSWWGKWGVYFSRWGEYLSADPREANMEGGVFPAIIGTVLMTFLMILVTVPMGVIAALYLREYAKQGWLVSLVRISVNNLAGVPSIVFGVFGLGFFVYGVGAFIDKGSPVPLPSGTWVLAVVGTVVTFILAVFTTVLMAKSVMKPKLQRHLKTATVVLWTVTLLALGVVLATNPYFRGFYWDLGNDPKLGKTALLWASLTLALLTLPVVIVSTEEALSAVPRSLRESSYGCGATKWQTIWRVVLPRAYPGILTGTILAIARGAGEVAPLMLVGAVKLAPELPLTSEAPFFGADRSFMHLGFHIFDLGFQSRNAQAATNMVYTTTLLLILIVVVLNLAAMWLRARLRKNYSEGQF